MSYTNIRVFLHYATITQRCEVRIETIMKHSSRRYSKILITSRTVYHFVLSLVDMCRTQISGFFCIMQPSRNAVKCVLKP